MEMIHKAIHKLLGELIKCFQTNADYYILRTEVFINKEVEIVTIWVTQLNSYELRKLLDLCDKKKLSFEICPFGDHRFKSENFKIEIKNYDR